MVRAWRRRSGGLLLDGWMGAMATADSASAGDGAGGGTLLPPELCTGTVARAFVFFVWIEMEKARGGARVYIARDL
jgi:hypothetical protein